MTSPLALLDPSQIPFAQQTGPPPLAPAPYATKPSIVDRIMGRLFPTGAYEGLLSPEAQQGIQQQGLLGLGAHLLQAGGGRPYQPGTLANLGGALAQSQTGFPQMADRALQLQAYRRSLIQQQAIAGAAAAHPAQPNESQNDTYKRLSAIIADVATVPGGDELAGKLAPVLASLKPARGGEPVQIKGVIDTQLGSPTIGMTGTMTIDPASHERIRFDPEGAGGKFHIEKVTLPDGTVRSYYLPDTPGAGKPVPTGLPEGRAAGGAGSQLIGSEARAAAQRLLEAHLTGSQLEQQNVTPSTAAAAIGGVVRKIAGEGAGQGVTNALRGSNTNAEQQAAGRWADAYISLTPKGRGGSPALRDQIMRTYWPQEGDDPSTVGLKATARKAATAALARAVATGTPPALPGFEPVETPP